METKKTISSVDELFDAIDKQETETREDNGTRTEPYRYSTDIHQGDVFRTVYNTYIIKSIQRSAIGMGAYITIVRTEEDGTMRTNKTTMTSWRELKEIEQYIHAEYQNSDLVSEYNTKIHRQQYWIQHTFYAENAHL